MSPDITDWLPIVEVTAGTLFVFVCLAYAVVLVRRWIARTRFQREEADRLRSIVRGQHRAPR